MPDPANTGGQLLPSAARTTAQNTDPKTNHGHAGVAIFLDVTAASGTGGLTVTLEARDPVSGKYKAVNASPAAVIATGTYVYLIHPGAVTAGGFTQVTQQPLPQEWRVKVAVGDATSYTYSVGAALLV